MKSVIVLGVAVVFLQWFVDTGVQARSPRVMVPSYYEQQPQPPQVTTHTRFQVVHRAPGEVKIVSKSTYTDGYNFIGGVSTGKHNAGGPLRKKVDRVDPEKFKECIFFRLCSKSQCFHYGRHNTCE